MGWELLAFGRVSVRKAIVTIGVRLAFLASLSAAPAAGVAHNVTKAAPPAGPPPHQVSVSIVSTIGTGCPLGTTRVAASPSNSAFTVSYSTFQALVGVGAGPTDFRTNCQIEALVHVPQGFTYAIAEADYRGFASLAPGASGYERAEYFFQGMSATPTVTHYFSGPFHGNWMETDRPSLVFLPCGEQRYLNIDTSLFVNPGTSAIHTTSLITMSSAGGFHFAWRSCRR
jgi:Domain of unknown function (DUF4360)